MLRFEEFMRLIASGNIFSRFSPIRQINLSLLAAVNDNDELLIDNAERLEHDAGGKGNSEAVGATLSDICDSC